MKLTEKQIEAGAKAAYESYYGVTPRWEVETNEKIKELWRRIIFLTAPHVQYAQPIVAEQTVDEDVIVRMLQAWFEDNHEAEDEGFIRRMTAAAHVLLDAMRGPVTPKGDA